MEKRQCIESGSTCLGIELGSTRIKAVLIDRSGEVLAVGFHDWENSLLDGIWTYSLEEIHAGLKSCYRSLKEAVEKEYGCRLRTVGAMGISAMMHGYMAFDKEGTLLSPFQTWRNSNTEEAADRLTALFRFNIPLRWTIAHLYQCVLDKEEHLRQLSFVTTLASYIHFLLTGVKCSGIGDAAGIFPIDSGALDYDARMVSQFDGLLSDRGYGWTLRDVLPQVLTAGTEAGKLSEAGAAFLDPEGELRPGIPFCPPEGDAGTGMVATNAVAPATGNVSAGTSTFAMLVLSRGLSKLYREIDMVTTPDGYPVAMAHANNGTSDLNAWVGLFRECLTLFGVQADSTELYGRLYRHSLEGDKDCGALLPYGYYSGEGITHLNEGRPLFVRKPDSAFTLSNFMRAHLYSSLGAVKLGLDILLKEEKLPVKKLTGHGGLFKTKGVMQRYLAAAANAPVTVMETASEGGPWGMALLAAYLLYGKERASLSDYLEQEIFRNRVGVTEQPDPQDTAGFERFMEDYRAGLEIERAATGWK